MDLKIGADPEFFVKKDGQFVSAFGLIEGTKHNPLKVDKGAVQVDGMALEFNIDPASSKEEFKDNIHTVLAQLRAMVPPEYEFVYVPVAPFGAEYIQAQPDAAKILGCDPDFNAYTHDKNPTPQADTPFRTASGHIHIGWTEGEDINNPDHIEACEMMVKQLDALNGIAASLWDTDNTRRQLYGKAGAYRPKPYGVEYRVMSNVWLNDPLYMDLVYDLAVFAFKNLVDGYDFSKGRNRMIQKIININSLTASATYGELTRNYIDEDTEKLYRIAKALRSSRAPAFDGNDYAAREQAKIQKWLAQAAAEWNIDRR